ncbi:hypothetical protein CDD81_3285 [Ophiocordyceps australis]|uniref:RRM domain-containing protein n=1 Tax=Ophiocordyceps australis TaxID=1399860 RepID=A0A2C5YDU4_9HYPO|nr:hypothetical protein CDD81_3285 [Ophiocordyceps australis]
MADASRWKATVFVGGLSQMVTNSNIYDAFIPFGEIVEVQMPKPDSQNSSDAHRGFAYVQFEDAEDAVEAIDNMNQSELFGRTLKVSAAKPPKKADEGLSSKRAVWEQEGWLAEHAGKQGNEDPLEQSKTDGEKVPDPMQGLEELDVAGPRPA